MSGLVVRDLAGMEEYRAAFSFQDEVWGPDFTEGVPASMQKVAQWVGGVAAGAFEDGEMVGFVFGITGVRAGELVHWSDILAVRAGARDGGIGRRLKWHQRLRAMEAGARTMQWTWDPLEARNGWLNLERLGAVADLYVMEMYGSSTSPLHTGIGTDRLVARWKLADPRVEAAAAGDPMPPLHWPDREPVYAFGVSASGRPEVDVDDPEVAAPDPECEYRVPLPPELQDLKRDDPDQAWAWRVATRAALAPTLDQGWTVVGMERTSGGGAAYRLLKEDHHGTRADAPPRGAPPFEGPT
jgi:predicted GNAT superfamily acetyltransferase